MVECLTQNHTAFGGYLKFCMPTNYFRAKCMAVICSKVAGGIMNEILFGYAQKIEMPDIPGKWAVYIISHSHWKISFNYHVE